MYRERWSHDKVVRTTHGELYRILFLKVFVKNGVITWETNKQITLVVDQTLPEFEPRGCPRGASFSWYEYSPLRILYHIRCYGVVDRSIRNASKQYDSCLSVDC